MVVGASGLVGYAALKHFAALDGSEVIGVSRGVPKEAAGATVLPLDLTDREQCEAVLREMRDISHVIYAALSDYPVGSNAAEREYVDLNLLMLRNLMEPLERASSGLEHISVVHGRGAYRATRESRVPLRESDRRVLVGRRSDVPSYRMSKANLYFAQEDYLRASQVGKRWAWTIWRPTHIFGETAGMNPIPALGVYGALLREKGEPLHYPGNSTRVLREATDSELLAEAFEWAALNPKSRNQIYNISNGDQFVWQDAWPTIARALGMEPGGPRPMYLAIDIPGRKNEWADIVSKYQLKSSPDPSEVAGQAFTYLDHLFAERTKTRVMLESTIKLRRHGFEKCMDTDEMLGKWFQRLQTNRMLPMPR